MRSLLRQPLARRLIGTAAAAALADWVVFAALVALVDRTTGGSPFAVALVLLAKIVPSVVLGPLVAPWADVLGLRRTLVAVDAARAAGVLAVALAPGLGGVLAALTAFELAQALSTAARESATSRGVERSDFEVLNTVTGVLAYGMVPIGGLVAAGLLIVHPLAPFALAAACHVGGAVTWATSPALASLRPSQPQARRGGGRRASALGGLHAVAACGPLRDVVAAAVVGVVAIAMLFSLGPVYAEHVLGSSDRYGLLLALLGAGALPGAVLARRRTSAALGLAVAGAGSVLLLATGAAAAAGVVLVGAGAAIAYVATQSRLQHVADATEEFAAAFAAIKAATGVALLTAPALHRVGGLPAVTAVMAACALAGAWWYAGRVEGRGPVRAAFLALCGAVLRALVRVRVDGVLPVGGAVLASNHPTWLEGPIAVAIDPRRVRPVAKVQPNPLLRRLIRLGGGVEVGRGALDAAVGHLRAGGLVWLAPEGRANDGAVLGRPRSGAARMALETGAPIVPAAILGTRGARLRDARPWRRLEVTVRLADPVEVADESDVTAAGDRVMAALAAATDLRWTPAEPQGSAPVTVPRPEGAAQPAKDPRRGARAAPPASPAPRLPGAPAAPALRRVAA